MTGRRITRACLGALAVGATLSVLPLSLPGLGGGAAPAVVRLDAQREQVRVLEAELSRIDAAAAVAADAAADARGRLADLKEQIRRNGTAARRARVAHARASDHMSERLVAMYTRRQPDMVTVLLTSGSLNEAVEVRDVWARIGRHDADLVTELRESRARLAEARRSLVSQRADAADAAVQATDRVAEMEDLLGRRRLVLDRARTELDGLIARRERAAALARARAAAETAARRRAAARPSAPPPATPSTAPAASAGPSTTPAAPTTPPEPPAPASGGDGPVAGGPSYAVLGRIAQCESGGNPRAVSSSGQYRGKYQFDTGTWASVGGAGDPAAASEAEQDRRAAMLYIERGPSPWPICGYR